MKEDFSPSAGLTERADGGDKVRKTPVAMMRIYTCAMQPGTRVERRRRGAYHNL